MYVYKGVKSKYEERSLFKKTLEGDNDTTYVNSFITYRLESKPDITVLN